MGGDAVNLAPRFYLTEDWNPHEDTVFQIICNLAIHKDVVLAQIPAFIRANSAPSLRPRNKNEWERRFTKYVSRKWATGEIDAE